MAKKQQQIVLNNQKVEWNRNNRDDNSDIQNFYQKFFLKFKASMQFNWFSHFACFLTTFKP